MKRYRYNSKQKNNRAERIGFFTAFSVCIVAIGLALWSTYASIGGLEGNTETDSSSGGYMASLTGSAEAVGSEKQGVTVAQNTTLVETSAEATTEAVTETEAQTTETQETELSEPTFSEDEGDKLQTILQITSSLDYPVESKRVTKEYSEQAVYSETMGDYRPHTGTDFQADVNAPVYSVCDGLVDDITKDDAMGNIIKITDGVYSVYYCGVADDMLVAEGDVVLKGQQIASVGGVPVESDDESHLHMEVRVSGNPIDPMTVISNDK